VPDVTAFIIAGGKSSRMGQDKAFLQVDGRMMIDHAILQAHSAADEIFIVGPKEKFGAFGRIVKDIFEDCGPLGGLHAALSRSRTNLSVVLAVDTPFIAVEFLKLLVDEAKASRKTVTVARAGGGLQPLCAVYAKDFLPIAEASLEAKKYKIDPLFPKDNTHIVDLAQHPEFDPAMFQNINSPEDLANIKLPSVGKSQSAKRS
jgi:molybdopterin-guanine dinucleotide biosynthesis protein A